MVRQYLDEKLVAGSSGVKKEEGIKAEGEK
jgi:hypothetical protein